MRRRIVSLLCVVAVLAAMLSVCIVTTLADDAVKLAEPISGTLNADAWDTPANISADGYLIAPNNAGVKTVNSVVNYNLGLKWDTSLNLLTKQKYQNGGGNISLKIGELEVTLYNVWYDKTKPAGSRIIKNAYIELKAAGVSAGTYDLGPEVGAIEVLQPLGDYIALSYDNGAVTVSYGYSDKNGSPEITDVITTNIENLDFSDVSVKLSVKGNYVPDFLQIRGFNLLSAGEYGSSSSDVTSSEPASSVPASSEPASSVPASSVPASSVPASSEPASSVPASSVPASSEPASSDVTSSEPEVGEKVTESISGVLVAADWDPAEAINSAGSFFADGNTDKKKTITAVKKYNLGTDWESSITIAHISNSNCYGQPFSLKVGDLEAVLYNCKYNKGTSAVTQNAYIALNVKGEEVAKYDLGDKAGTFDNAIAIRGVLGLKYKDGKAQVTYKGDVVLTYDVTDLDFSNAEISLTVAGNFVSNAMGISAFSLSAAYKAEEGGEGEGEGGEVVKGDPIETIENGVFNATDWEGAVDKIRADGALYILSGSADIFSVKSYDLSGGFKFASKLVMKNGFNNFGGEYCAMYVGEPGTGLELRIQQDKEGRGNSAFYNGYIYYGGEKVATVDLLNDPNGTYEIRYSGGKVSVYLKDTAIAWTLADGSTSTSVTLNNPDFSNVKLGFNVKGNWHPSERYWMGYSLAPLGSSGTGAGGTGDTRNIVVPVCVMVASVCALAFVLTRKKSRT